MKLKKLGKFLKFKLSKSEKKGRYNTEDKEDNFWTLNQ